MAFSVIEELKKGTFQPFYVVYGEEHYLIEKILHTIKETMLDPDWSDFNYATLDMLKMPIEVAIEEAESFPFGDGRRVVVASNALFLTGANLKGAIDHNTDALMNFLEHPTDFSSLILVVPHNKLDERKKLVKAVLKKCRVVHAASLSPKEWEQWIRNRLQQSNIQVTTDGFNFLLRNLPNNLQIVENEIEKLSLYVHNEKAQTLGLEQLHSIISRTVESNVFDLVEKVANRNFQAAYEIYRELMKQNEEPIMIIALLARQFRMILQCKVMDSQGYSQKQIASQLKVHPYPVKLAIDQGKRFKEGQLLDILQKIAQLDYQMKTGQTDRHLGLEMLLLYIQAQNNKAIQGK